MWSCTELCWRIRIEGAGGKDEVKVCLVLQAPLEPSALLDWCVERLPRFVEVVPALEKTSTGKVRKDDLRRSGITAETWDREAAGYALPRYGRQHGGGTDATDRQRI